MSYFFHEAFVRPILNLLVLIYDILPYKDLGLAIILLTVLIKLLLYPLSQKSIKSQKDLQDLQPKIEEIKTKYKDNKEEMTKAMLAIYKENKVNPFSSCLPLLVQFPFLIAIFRVFSDGLTAGAMSTLYFFVPRPEVIHSVFLGFIDLSKPNVIIAVLAGAAQFWQAKMLMAKRPAISAPESKDEDFAAIMNKQMLYFAPVLTIIIGLKLAGGLSLYWLVGTLFTILQQLIIFRPKKNSPEAS